MLTSDITSFHVVGVWLAEGSDEELLDCAHDALGRPVSRNADSFAYNARGEVAAVTAVSGLPSPVAATYAYDLIGNAALAAHGSLTNRYSANILNQYTSVLRVSAPPCETVPGYDADGNLVSLALWTCVYDVANRLVSVSSNGAPLVTSSYDWRGRRVHKTTPDATYTFFYDDWNLVEERIAYTNGVTSTIHYYWGKDVSGTLQGAGNAPVAKRSGCLSEANPEGRKGPRVGGLLYLTVDDVPFVPCYDSNGNVTRYLDASGRTVAQYVYDAFGGTISASGPLADAFRFRFSTKYNDAETGLYYYGYRFYSPALRRWLTRDPSEERGGLNLYGFCGNNAVANYDKDGRAYFAVRGLGKFLPPIRWSSFFSCPFMKITADLAADALNVELLHEQLFYGDGGSPSSIGWGEIGLMEDESPSRYVRRGREYDDCIMRIAQSKVKPTHYQLTWVGSRSKCNCQDYADALRAKYHEIENDPEVKCKCKKGE